MYESFDTLCIYLESDQLVGTDPDKNFWVRYRIRVVNQKYPDSSVWKETSICTKTWNNSVLQFMKVPDMLEEDAGFLVCDTVVFVCEIMDCCPWFEFFDLEVCLFLVDAQVILISISLHAISHSRFFIIICILLQSSSSSSMCIYLSFMVELRTR